MNAVCPANHRLYIHIEIDPLASYQERLLFGLSSTAAYTLHYPAGSVKASGNITASAGLINSYLAACNGPLGAANAGYDPVKIDFTSSDPSGDYYMDLPAVGTPGYQYFDFQVVTGANDPALAGDFINGRVFAQAWRFYAALAPPTSDPFSGSFYVYSDDGITTLCKFKNAYIGECMVYCNEHGCLSSTDPIADRQSNNNNTSGTFANIAQYKIFLNNPDPAIYLDGAYGQMTNKPQYPYMDFDPAYAPCSGNKLIYLSVNKPGNINITLTFPTPLTSRQLSNKVTSGFSTIPWDGKDGSGTLVPDGTSFTAQVTFVNGLTNLPLWDIEDNLNGFKVTLVRPPVSSGANNPKTYWDDSKLIKKYTGMTCTDPPQQDNSITGCTPVAGDDGGCHKWTSDETMCHDKMINTWWYSASTDEATIYPVQIVTPPAPTLPPCRLKHRVGLADTGHSAEEYL